MQTSRRLHTILQRHVDLIAAASAGLIFWILAHWALTPYLNYTFSIASALLQGHLGLMNPPSWLNELVPSAGGYYYSVFPLGAVLSAMPFSLLVAAGLLPTYPVALVVGLLAALSTWLAYRYTLARPQFTRPQRLVLALWVVLGSWYMTNMLFAGAWQLALGFAVLGELAALYWSVVKPRPLLAGLGLALAFGNRTELILTAPIILAYLLRPHWAGRRHWRSFLKLSGRPVLWFLLIPVVLGIVTLIYNAARFGSPSDFGYARLPGVLEEPWYRHGIFSLTAIPDNARQMLWQGWKHLSAWPYFVPTGWGGSIILASPFLLLLLRKPAGDTFRVVTAWAALAILTFSLWIHGNTGGWQYSYRYSLILLPWILVLFVEYVPPRVTKLEVALGLLSLGMNALATWLFLFTSYLR